MVGLVVGAIQLLVMLNACVRSMFGRWVAGSVAGVFRTVLFVALTMAMSRVRRGAEPAPSFYLALYAGPALSVLVTIFAHARRRSMPAGSDERTTADQVFVGWVVLAGVDVLLVGLAFAARAFQLG